MEPETKINYGYKPDIIKVGEDFIFGGFTKVPELNLQPNSDWSSWLPQKELQNLHGVETFACVTFTILNCIEILIRRQYGEEKNYAERFLASVSGTKVGGNTPQTVCEFLRKIGVVPEELWPFSPEVTSFEKYYENIPPKLYELAREFNNEWEFLHEFVPNSTELIRQALKSSPLAVSVPAWYERNGKYYRPDGVADNHLTTLIKENTVFDSYDSIIKELEPISHQSIKRFYIRKKLSTPTLTLWQKLKYNVRNIFK